MSYFVYILLCSDSTFYCGLTNNLEKRLHKHNNTKAGARYTSTRRPVEMIYYEELPNISEAIKRERQIKKLSKLQKQKLISAKI